VKLSNPKASKRVKKGEFVTTPLVVDKCLLHKLDHLARQDTLKAYNM